MTDDPVLAAVQRFMDAVEVRLAKRDDEMRSALAESRAALAILETRAAQHGPQGERGEPGPAGRDGNGISVTVSAGEPIERKPGDLWIVP